jgi:hypothetical protein
MAHRLPLAQRPEGLPFIWNVSTWVGDNLTCPNRPTDVELVKYLFMARLGANDEVWVRIHPALHIPLAVNGQFDIVLAYYIYRYEAAHNNDTPDPKIDGWISPAKATGPIMQWAIFRLNKKLAHSNRLLWENLPDAPGISPMLRQELKTATR